MFWYGIERVKDYGFSFAKRIVAALKGITRP